MNIIRCDMCCREIPAASPGIFVTIGDGTKEVPTASFSLIHKTSYDLCQSCKEAIEKFIANYPKVKLQQIQEPEKAVTP